MKSRMKFLRKSMPDTTLLLVFGVLLFTGLMAFLSASLGLFARDGEVVSSIVTNHLMLGFGLGSLACIICAIVPYRLWRVFAPYLYGASLILTALIFIPALGMEHGGSVRWLDLGFVSLQPSEPLKIGLVLMLASYFTLYRDKVDTLLHGFGGFALICAPAVILLLLQPDHGTLGILVITASTMFLVAGASKRHLAMIVAGGLIILVTAFFTHDYVRARIMTFIHPDRDPSGSSYQIQQSLIALGSGELTGRGFGRGIQKFQYLPEPIGDSIYAVIGEEFGFVGAAGVIALFVLFGIRGFSIAARAPDYFGGLLAVGITTYIVVQAFLNIAAMLGIVPLTGIPLVFISHGGTALLVALGAVGMLLSVSRHTKKG